MVKIFKLTGAGNNFLLVDLREATLRRSFFKYFRGLNRKKIAKHLCNPFQSVGADGLLFLDNSNRADLKWDFYNADGSRAEMCGNAARCVGRYVIACDGALADFTLETKAGIVGISVLPNKKSGFADEIMVEVEMPQVSAYQPNQCLKLEGKSLKFDFINTGVPHAVVQMASAKNLKSLLKNVDKMGKIVGKIRAQRYFKKHGTNVTFYSAQSRHAISSLTFERGVESYTQACGTGAVAAALSFTKSKPGVIKVRVPGGSLEVNLMSRKPRLIGPAKFTAEIYLN